MKRFYYVSEKLRVERCRTPRLECSHEHHIYLAGAGRELMEKLPRSYHITALDNLELCRHPDRCAESPHFKEKREAVAAHRENWSYLTPYRPLWNPYTSLLEEEVADVVQRLGLSIERHDRTLIAPYEVDIYASRQRLALEVNGDYWHSPEMMARRWREPHVHHGTKRALCAEKDVELLFVWESAWLQCPEAHVDAICEAIQWRRVAPILKSLEASPDPMVVAFEDHDRQGAMKARRRLAKRAVRAEERASRKS